MKSFLAIFIKHFRIMDYGYGKNLLNFGVDPTQNGGMAAFWMSVITYCTLIIFIDIR